MKETEPPVQEQEVPEEEIPETVQETEDYCSDASALKTAKAIIRLYRLRDEKAADEICDILLPLIGGLE